MKNWKKVIGVASAAAMTAAMMMPASVFAADETFKIGVIGPMTGDYAQYGTNVYNAAKIAADEINENGSYCFGCYATSCFKVGSKWRLSGYGDDPINRQLFPYNN